MNISNASLAGALWLMIAIGPVLLPQEVAAQRAVSAKRADENLTPLLVYDASVKDAACPPLAVVSHGAGSSEQGYRYLAESLSQSGFTTIVMGHRESGRGALRSDVETRGILSGLRALVSSPEAEQARLLDVGAALQWADAQCHSSFRVLLGHSMGAETVMLEAGAKNTIGVASPPAGQDRFDAYVALSPEGPGVVFSKHAWRDIHKPMLILTGTQDQSLKGGPEARQIPWHDLQGNDGKCQWLGVIDRATHLNFAGSGIGVSRVEPMVTQTIKSFLNGVRKSACAPPQPEAGMVLQVK